MFFREDIHADQRLALILHLGKLPLQAEGEVLEPFGQVEIALSHTLNSPVVAGPVAIIIFAQREQPLEIVALAIQAEHRQQPRRPAVAVQKRMNVDELKLRDAAACT